MRFKWSGKKFEYFRVDADWWGTIAPPDPSRFAPELQSAGEVYLDLGTEGNCIRNLYVENILTCDGQQFVFASGGATSFSGLLDTAGVYTSGQLTRWDGSFWQPYDLVATDGSFSGLTDVQSAGWTSGVHVGFDGTNFVPSTQGGGAGVGNHELISATHTDVTGTAASGHHLGYDGTNWVPSFAQPSGFIQPSGYQVPSGNYATVQQGHELWAASGVIIVQSGRFTQEFTGAGPKIFIHGLGDYPQVSILESGATTYAEADFQVVHDNINQTTIDYNGNISGLFIADLGRGKDGVDGADGADGASGTTYSGLSDVQNTAWISGDFSIFDGNTWVPFASGNFAGSGLDSGSPTVHVVAGQGITVTVNDVQFDTSFGDGRYAQSGFINPSGFQVPSGNYATIDHGNELWAQSGFLNPSGFQVPSGNYVTVSHGNELWAASGNLAPSGDYATVSQGHQLWAQSGFLNPSGFQVPSGNYVTVDHGNELWTTSGHTIESHSNFTTTTPLASGHHIGYDGTNWINTSAGTGGGGGSTTLDGLTDTNLGILSSGQSLSYNGTEWVNAHQNPSGFQVPSGNYATVEQGHELWAASGHTIESHTNFTTTTPLVSGHQIGFDGTNWVNTTPGTGGGSTTLDGLSDTTLGTLSSGQALSYNGSTWVNAHQNPSGFQVPSGNYSTVEQGHELWAASGHTIESHTNFTTTTPIASGHHIGYDGTNWVNTTAAAGGGGATTLDALTDTNLGTLVSGHNLSYNGAEWVNSEPDPGVPKRFFGMYNYSINHTNIQQIGIVESTDLREWTFASQEGITVGATGEFDDEIAKDQSLISLSGIYYCYYAGYDGSLWKIGLARSFDKGLTWAKHSSNPILNPSQAWENNGGSNEVHNPIVVFDRDEIDSTKRFKMWYAGGLFGGGGIGYAYSSDGITWTKYTSNPVISLGTGGEWDDSFVIPGAIIKVGNTWHFIYSGNDGNGTWSAGLATFDDPESTYTKDASNPILKGDGKESSLSATVTVGSTSATVADASQFPIGAGVWIYDANDHYFTHVVSGHNTFLELADPAPIEISNTDGHIVSAANNSVTLEDIFYDGAYRASVTVFQPSGQNSELGLAQKEFSMLAYGPSLTELQLDYGNGILIRSGVSETTDNLVSHENLVFIDTGEDGNRFRPSSVGSGIYTEGYEHGFDTNFGDDRYATSGFLNVGISGGGTQAFNVQSIQFLGGTVSSLGNAVYVSGAAGGGGGGNDILTINSSGQVEVRETIYTNILLADAIEFNIESIPIGYDYLEVHGQIKSDDSAITELMNIQFNGDVGPSNYRATLLQYGTAALGKFNTTDTWFGRAGGNTGDAGDFASLESKIFGYDEVDKYTYWHSRTFANSSTSAYNNEDWAGVYRLTTEISGFRIVPDSGANFVSGSWLEVVGVKKQWVVADGTLGDANIVNGMIVP